MDVKALQERKTFISQRLDVISIPVPANTALSQAESLQSTTSNPKKKKRGRRSVTPNHEPNDVPSEAAIIAQTKTSTVYRYDKNDTHWDYLLKEMKWLAADFQAERKRHLGLSRRMAVSATLYCEGAAAREMKSVQDALLKQRKLAARIGRECTKKFWSQIHRVITYKQKVSYDTVRRDAMNQQLVQLVQQTEKYTALLSMTSSTTDDTSSRRDDTSIEQALANSTVRRSKNRVRDYARLLHVVETTDGETSYYGESTDDNSGSDATYDIEEDDLSTDDESTLRAAEEEEWRERHLSQIGYDDSTNIHDEALSFVADPIELRLLQEEADMDVDKVLERLKADGLPSTIGVNESTAECIRDETTAITERRMQFLGHEIKQRETVPCSTTATVVIESDVMDTSSPAHEAVTIPDGSDADDDMDASDVDDYDDNYDGEEEDDDEFMIEVEDVDDETTLEQEELLPREIPVADEIRILKQESELSVEELRLIYGGALLAPSLNEGLKNADTDNNKPRTRSNVNDLEPEEMEVEIDVATSVVSGLLLPASKGKVDAMVDEDEDEEDYVPEETVDDETTIEAEEKLGRDMSYTDELSMLRREAEMSVGDLRAFYAQMNNKASTESANFGTDVEEMTIEQLHHSIDDQENDEEFVPHDDVPDDESTLEAEDKLGPEMNPDEEIALLKKENECPIEELIGMYGALPADCSDSESTPRKRTREEDERSESGAIERTTEKQLKLELKPVVVSRPFLIPSRVTLREYQHVGLSWLVSLQSRRLNGILADEMGLGKTLQTISLLAYLAAYKGIWGPHLIIVPTSVILNWETELKRFCPALKVLCYYGSAKRRKELRAGWTKSNWYHVVITSYQLVVQDSFAFKRKRWYYLVLDEAQHIKNFQSQRWQTLISFNTQRRLLLTGTPLQNNLMELWSLLHFLMPYIFRSRKEFSYWFANPMNSMIEGASNQNDDVVHRLHGIIRPFILRRLKKDVETQMPGKFEHIIKCQLSRRQMFIYEEFMARSSTRQALTQGANFMGMMNVLMQLRKVCNHPDLFEPRSVVTPLVVDPISFPMASCVIGLTSCTSVFEKVSSSFICPLWCGSEGQPSFSAAYAHDKTQSDELLTLEANMDFKSSVDAFDDCCSDEDVCPALRALFAEVIHGESKLRQENIDFQNELNSRRCRAFPFAYPRRLIDNVIIPAFPLERSTGDVLSYPMQLLAMRRDLYERADDVSGILKRFVFAVPKADARPVVLHSNIACNDSVNISARYDNLAAMLQESLRPFREAHARLTTYFPDKKLIQFDAGKLQALAELLRERKHGGHKVLIFTQMSKMLDILEAFLNMNGHTYVRLDGGTSIELRQRLMDRFNSDSKLFCFILSTRSGGTGVNLTGADTVVFYDSDWNPAQDAQAQDRAHRIGQTREVHIFRLVTEHTIEENILRKAKQKRNLDVLVMDQGNFDASMMNRNRTKAVETAVESKNETDLYTKGGLREIFGIQPIDIINKRDDEDVVSSELLETTMTSLEDIDDANALKGSRKEAEEELREFDESIEYKKDSDADDDDEVKAESVIHNVKDDTKSEEKELEKEIAAWQEKAGVDPSLIEASLSPVERYGLRFCEVVNPYYSVFSVLEYNHKLESHTGDDDIDINEIEQEQAAEENRAFEEGDLLSTNPRPDDLLRQISFYRREKSRLNGNKRRRKLTGEDWEQRYDLTQNAFWYNVDTGEAIWEKPRVLVDMDSYNRAYQQKWSSLPIKPLIHMMSYLYPCPDRTQASEVCSHWCKAAKDSTFIRHVYPVEMGAYTRDDSKLEYNHYRTIDDAVKSALPGDTIEFGDGHYWQNTDLIVDIPLKFVGDEKNPSNVNIEMSGMIIWRAGGGFIEGMTFRRPNISSEKMLNLDLLLLEHGAKLHLLNSVLDNEGRFGNVATLIGPGKKGSWESVVIQRGIVGMSLTKGAIVELSQCSICRCKNSGVTCDDESDVKLIECKIERNCGNGVALTGHSHATVRRSHFVHNTLQPIEKDSGCSTTSSGNFCTNLSTAALAPPGFQFL